MIEAIIGYIQDQGFEVHVFHHAGYGRGYGVLCVRKLIVNDHLDHLDWAGFDWAILPEDLNARIDKTSWFAEADQRIAQLRKVIEEKQREL